MSHHAFSLMFATTLMTIFLGCGNPRNVVASPRVDAPPPGKALINFYNEVKIDNRQAIHNERKELVFLVAPRTIHQLIVEPGVHDYYVACYTGGIILSFPSLDSMIRIHAAADRIYDVQVTFNLFNVMELKPAHPGTPYHEDVLPLLSQRQTVGPVNRSLPDIQKREKAFSARLDEGQKQMREDPDFKFPEMQAGDSRAP